MPSATPLRNHRHTKAHPPVGALRKTTSYSPRRLKLRPLVLLIPILLAALLSTQPHAFAANVVITATVNKNSSKPPREINKPVPCPLGLAWGDSATTIQKVMLAQGYTQNVYPNADKFQTDLQFSANGIRLDGEKVDTINFVLYQKGLCYLVITFAKPVFEQNTPALFHRIVPRLVAAYGPPSMAVSQFDPPFKSGDKQEITAVETGSAHEWNLWLYHPSKLKTGPGNISIVLSGGLGRYPRVVVQYRNAKFQQSAVPQSP